MSKTHWNYRVMKKNVGDETCMGIHEVYYSDDKVVHWTDSPIAVCDFPEDGETDALSEVLDKMKLALNKPTLNWEDGSEL